MQLNEIKKKKLLKKLNKLLEPHETHDNYEDHFPLKKKKMKKDLKYLKKQVKREKKLVGEQTIMKESAETLLQSIIDQKPLETQNIFDSLVKDKVENMLADAKTALAIEKFGGEKNDTDEEEEVELSDEEIETMLSQLSDEDLENLIADLDAEEDGDEVVDGGSDDDEAELEGEEDDNVETPEIEEGKKELRADLEKKMAEYKSKGGKVTVGRTSKKEVAGGLREDQELEESSVTRKHFKMAAETIKALPENKRKEHAEMHANLYAKQNPRFNRAKFMEACGVKE